MDILSFETAQKLKAAGFPQPDFAPRQTWYDEGGRLHIVVGIGGLIGPDMAMIGGRGHVPYVADDGIDNPVFAPTATDILLELRSTHLCYYLQFSHADAKFWVYSDDTTMSEIAMIGEVGHENPAEACALAWLAINKK
jgi:hypothetical protein